MPINQPAVCHQQLQQMTGWIQNRGGVIDQEENFKVSKLADEVSLSGEERGLVIALLLGVLGSFAQLQHCFKHFSAVTLFSFVFQTGCSFSLGAATFLSGSDLV